MQGHSRANSLRQEGSGYHGATDDLVVGGLYLRFLGQKSLDRDIARHRIWRFFEGLGFSPPPPPKVTDKADTQNENTTSTSCYVDKDASVNTENFHGGIQCIWNDATDV